jgi:Fe-S-cluster containining protein
MPLAPIAGEPASDGADCVACGRCCHHAPNTASLLEADEARMGEPLLTRLTIVYDKPPHFRFMKNDGDKCAALDTSVAGKYPCGVYAVRPDGCRAVEPGSPACMEARALGHLGTSTGFTRIA